MPYYQYVYYGNSDGLRRHYDNMKRYVDYLSTRTESDGTINIGLRDWSPAQTKTEAGITDTAYYYVDAKIVALAAKLLNKQEDVDTYTALAEKIKKAFNSTFYDPNTGLYDNGGQTALGCALYQGLIEPENHQRVLENLINVIEQRDWHIDTGCLGAKYVP